MQIFLINFFVLKKLTIKPNTSYNSLLNKPNSAIAKHPRSHTGKQLEELRAHAREEYSNIVEVYCPYFKQKIAFNSEGFNHLRYRKARNERHAEVQYIRYKMLAYAPEIVRHSNTLQTL